MANVYPQPRVSKRKVAIDALRFELDTNIWKVLDRRAGTHGKPQTDIHRINSRVAPHLVPNCTGKDDLNNIIQTLTKQSNKKSNKQNQIRGQIRIGWDDFKNKWDDGNGTWTESRDLMFNLLALTNSLE
jgi:hypothetical protein